MTTWLIAAAVLAVALAIVDHLLIRNQEDLFDRLDSIGDNFTRGDTDGDGGGR